MFKGYRTIAFNAIMTLLMLTRIWSYGEPPEGLPSAADVERTLDLIDAALVAAWGLGNSVLRAVTDTPIFRNEPEIQLLGRP